MLTSLCPFSFKWLELKQLMNDPLRGTKKNQTNREMSFYPLTIIATWIFMFFFWPNNFSLIREMFVNEHSGWSNESGDEKKKNWKENDSMTSNETISTRFLYWRFIAFKMIWARVWVCVLLKIVVERNSGTKLYQFTTNCLCVLENAPQMFFFTFLFRYF